MALRFDVITIFPSMFEGFLGETIIARARRAQLVEVHLTDLRDFTTDRHRSVDDKPYGGGPGMVFKPEPVFRAVESVLGGPGSATPEGAVPDRTRKVLLCPQGKRLVQSDLWSLAEAERIVLLCGRYEGFDERIRSGLGFEEVSIGDYVLSGGEVPAMAIIEGVVRLIPGALGDAESPLRESFQESRLEFPQYTRPSVFRGMKVPEVLVSGDHGRIARWREEEALKRTRERRKDLLLPGRE
jgi:tRNA (guanine37-N1)-methyltransferase